ncbi:hypothetical protein [Rhizobium sp. L245/93]|uniref:hypothetical protein n=1 Tax=Rhizobium sp. L245/93 TaxID=2819998 RepID=UPI001AD9C4E9|nr:hypothetical protein [Rhizobium sp. L245/93]MBO9172258.1 hypothetical protein [Rhizobium sp. L245/93]
MIDEPQPVMGAVKQGFIASMRLIGLEPIDHFAHVFKRAMSVKLILIVAAFSGLEVALPYIDEWIVIPRGLFAAVSGFTNGGLYRPPHCSIENDDAERARRCRSTDQRLEAKPLSLRLW